MRSRLAPLRPSALVAALLLVVAACASSSQQTPDPAIQYTGFDPKSGRFTVGAGGAGARPPDQLLMDVDKAWALLPKAYESLGLPLTVSNPETKVLGMQNVVVHKPIGGERLSRLLDCGVDVNGPNADYYEVHLTVVSGVEKSEGGGSVLRTQVAAWAAPTGLSSSVRCASTGRLEERVAIAMGISR